MVAAGQLGPDMTICSDCPDGYSAGDERLFVIASKAQSNAEALNLKGLVENCGGNTATRSAAAVNDFLGTLAAAPSTRGNMGSMGVPYIWVEQFNWTVLPKQEVFARNGLLMGK